MSQSQVDLLSPAEVFRENYIYQMRQTIDAYSVSMIVMGEALQNAIDAVCDDSQLRKGKILIDIDFDSEKVSIADNGKGFPDNISLLYLGGTDKQSKNTKGKIGVGIKVSMFSSSYFCIRSRSKSKAWKLEIQEAYKFETVNVLRIPDPLPDDVEPLSSKGTQITCQFPKPEAGKSKLDIFVQEVVDTTIPREASSFGQTVKDSAKDYPSPFAALLSSFLRRYSYLGDVLAAIDKQEEYPREGLEVEFRLQCSDPISRFGSEIGRLFGDQALQVFQVEPKYLRVEDTLSWVSKGKLAPRVFQEKLGPGGSKVEQSSGFNVLMFNSPEDYEALLVNAKEQPSKDLEVYKNRLFPFINGMLLMIGRIPDFEKYLPGGSRRVISCNGVVTGHDIDLTRGRNQQYVRCFDLVIDLNAELNYGKTQLKNSHLVKLTRDYINEAYVRVIQNAAGKWVGRLSDEEIDEETDIFLCRQDLGLAEFTTRKVPRDENDVIGLFFEMAGRNLFPNYRFFGLSQKDRYDCRAAVQRESDPESVLDPREDSKLRVVEFKVHAAEVIRDFERFQKFPRELQLVIAWDVGTYESNKYGVYDIDQSNAYKASPSRVFPKVSKYIYDAKTGAEIQLLLIEDVVRTIKNDKT